MLCGTPVGRWLVSDFFQIWIPRGRSPLGFTERVYKDQWKRFLQHLSTYIVILLAGTILTGLCSELLRLICFMLLAWPRWHTLLHRTSSKHNMCLQEKGPGKTSVLCIPCLVQKAFSRTLENRTVYPPLAGQSPHDYPVLEPLPVGVRPTFSFFFWHTFKRLGLGTLESPGAFVKHQDFKASIHTYSEQVPLIDGKYGATALDYIYFLI